MQRVPATKQKKEEAVERKFEWKELSDVQALLYGPDGEVVAEAVIVSDLDDMSDLSWRVESRQYEVLNLREYNTAISLADMERRVLVLLGSELARERGELDQRRGILDSDISNILGMLWEQETFGSGKDFRIVRQAYMGGQADAERQ